jgi:hypothetical protein
VFLSGYSNYWRNKHFSDGFVVNELVIPLRSPSSGGFITIPPVYSLSMSYSVSKAYSYSGFLTHMVVISRRNPTLPWLATSTIQSSRILTKKLLWICTLKNLYC